jgi:hypothetical protein
VVTKKQNKTSYDSFFYLNSLWKYLVH